MPTWKRMRFKENKVWMAMDQNEKPITKNGRVLIKYQLDQDYEYWVHEDKVYTLAPDAAGVKACEQRPSSSREPKTKKRNARGLNGSGAETGNQKAVHMYTDGASSGNPGPAGIGVVLKFGKDEKEISRYIGITTNNIAELEAIRAGLADLKTSKIPVRIYTDSTYAQGVLGLGWKASKNKELVESLCALIEKFHDLKIIKIKGHAGHPENERADALARAAIRNALK
jgi:ribonuclease HI